MLEILKAAADPVAATTHTPTRTIVLGVGNAGVNLVDRLILECPSQLETIAINTDLQSLVASVADVKIPIGENTTHGLGTGGNPLIGKEAATESQAALQASIENAAMVVICAGLGGGTGSSALPILLEIAHACKIPTVAAILTLPFHFEGQLRMQYAKEALEKIQSQLNILLLFENDRMLENAQPKLGIGETFAASDLFLSQAAIAITRLIAGNGPFQLTPGDLTTILQPNSGKSLFGFGRAEGEHRARNALEHALQNPLLDRGQLVHEASRRLLIHIDGPSDLRLCEVQSIAQEITNTCHPSTHILLGIHASGPSNPSAPGPIAVSLLGTYLPPQISVTPLLSDQSAATNAVTAATVTAAAAISSHPNTTTAEPALSIPPTVIVLAPPPPQLVEQEPILTHPTEPISITKVSTNELLLSHTPLDPSPSQEIEFSTTPIPLISESPTPTITTTAPSTPVEHYHDNHLPLPPSPSVEELLVVEPPPLLPQQQPPAVEVPLLQVIEHLSEKTKEPVLEIPATVPAQSSSTIAATSSLGEPPAAAAAFPRKIPPPKPKQEILQFEPAARRGRFEKSEPTIVEGEDIDVPTFLRLKIKVK